MFSKLIEHAVFFFFSSRVIRSNSHEWSRTCVMLITMHLARITRIGVTLTAIKVPSAIIELHRHANSSFSTVPSIHLNFWTLFQAIGLQITLVILGFVLFQRNEIKRRKFIIQFHFDYKYLSSFSIINCPPNAAMKIDKQLIIQFITNNFH